MATTAIAKIGATLRTSDGKEYTVYENDLINDLVYTNGTATATLSGRVRVIAASTTAQNTGPTDCPPEPYVHRYISPTMLVIDSSDENYAILTRVNIANIVSIGSVTTAAEAAEEGQIVIGPGSQYQTLDTVIAAAEEGAVVKLKAGTYAAPITVTKSISIVSEDGAILTGAIKVDGAQNAEGAAEGDADTEKAPVTVTLKGLTLTGDALIDADNVDAFTMEGCTFENHNMNTKTMPISIGTKGTAAPMLVKIDNNVFGDQTQYSYNLIDVYSKLADGSSISNNEFTDQCCTHNQISLYGIDTGATVTINKNHAAISKNMVRIGFIGTPIGTVIMDGNSYDATDPDPAYAGLFLVQPYNKETLSFSGTTIKVNNTKAPSPIQQIGYIYAGAADTPWTEDNKPVIIVNGKPVTIPDSSAS